MKRVVLSSLLTFSLGVAGGVVGTRLLPADAPLPLGATPVIASEIKVALPAASDGIADLVDAVKGAVVNIDTVAQRQVPAGQAEMYRRFFGEEMPGQAAPVQKGVGSGFIIESNGLIVTNYHVVQGAQQLTVTLSDGRKLKGKVIGSDPSTDLAVVKIEAKNLPTLKLADPAKLRVGQYVVAVGSPLGLSQTVTAGILSAINRDIKMGTRVSYLQTDAPINPGNSGGPLLNLRGEVVGVNTAVAARGQGIGFAIPVDTLKTVVPQLEAKGKVERAWLGVGISDLPEDKSQLFYPEAYGALVGKVEPNSPAAKAGLKQGDILLQVNGAKLDGASALIREIGKLPVGTAVEVLVSRQGQHKKVTMTLDKMPDKLAEGPQMPEAPALPFGLPGE